MIIVRLTGGLGNQMFQYALGRRLADADAGNLWLDLGAFRSAGLRGETLRRFGLDAFAIKGQRLSGSRAALLLPFPRRLPRRLAFLPRWPGRVRVVREASKLFDPGVLAKRGELYLDGYWQTEKYFADIADIIRDDFALREPMTGQRAALVREIEGASSVSVHVRRGDYVTNASAAAFHGTCSPDWYAAALERIAAAVERPRFYVFSDDPAWVRANLPRGYDLRFVDPQPDGRDCQDMHVMARCRHHIIANSSFSWWGAWLNPSAAKRVIAPARWFAADPAPTDHVPATWWRM
jgi:Glycosyl transferase family 11